MKLLILGRGKTGSLVAEVAAERQHGVRTFGAKENASCAALAAEKLRDIDVVIDFTTPHSAIANIEACVQAGKNMVVGTTGWYGKEHGEIDRIRRLVEQHGTGFVYAANFSVGVNLFFDVARAAAAALRHGYSGQIFERHHVHKKDAPSGTAIAIQRVMREASGQAEGLEITSFREGEVVGLHEAVLESANDRIYLCHDAKSRRGFAEGAVLAAEWIEGKKGFYDFKDVWREL
ncbi:Dihydrodipicolinate reductase [Candidatus Sulfotelmatobacter kueseliae]|uniref:4-hydroxy-tetrahydrodipicolinate reductase n=1 Tax=Candidatus Sulfotelmatobacter kueseliae TaxID=2042962 RepID=A0A2U3K8F0_9BACT|nr:Dihydrodipicolinate reductase [Candidatus Sulfotelmatobacter kueseliae]